MAKVEGGTTDTNYAREEVVRLSPMTTFTSITELVARATDFAQKIRQTGLANPARRKSTAASTSTSTSLSGSLQGQQQPIN